MPSCAWMRLWICIFLFSDRLPVLGCRDWRREEHYPAADLHRHFNGWNLIWDRVLDGVNGRRI